MELYCTRPGCLKPANQFPDLDDPATLKTVPQKYCTACGMELMLLGRYLPSKLLGQGGFGAAFLARDRYTPGMRQCVVKQFQPSGRLNPQQLLVAQELFEREGEALEDVGNAHPQIPDLYAFFELTVRNHQGANSQCFYLVQEFIDGQTMEAELTANGPFSVDQVTAMLRAILPVLTFVHSRGLIHRDIKPSNIMRHRNGLFYLLDFGAVKQATKGGRTSPLTGIYSIGFAPPEQITGTEVFPSTDLYALAVTCIMLLTGHPPDQLFDAHSNTWKWRDRLPHPVGNPLGAVLDRMLLPTPSLRFQTAAAVLTALEQPATTASHPVTPPPPVATRPAPLPPTTLPSHPTPNVPAPAKPPGQVARKQGAVAPFSTLELIGSAAFTGFEGGLLAIALVSLLGTSLVSAGFWLVLLATLVFAQSKRVIERIDLVIIAALTLVPVLLFSPLHRIVSLVGAENPFLMVLLIASIAGLLAIAVTTLFRLIYKLLMHFS